MRTSPTLHYVLSAFLLFSMVTMASIAQARNDAKEWKKDERSQHKYEKSERHGSQKKSQPKLKKGHPHKAQHRDERYRDKRERDKPYQDKRYRDDQSRDKVYREKQTRDKKSGTRDHEKRSPKREAKKKQQDRHRDDPRQDRSKTDHKRSTSRDARHLKTERQTHSIIKKKYRTHDRHYEKYAHRLRKDRHYHKHETYHYHTRYLAPIKYRYHRHGHRVHYLPVGYISIYLHGTPYFYFGGVFYSHHTSGYIVVRAPIGVHVSVLPIGFISFYIGPDVYYYVNDTYYLYDDELEAYVVVKKPVGADKAMEEETSGRLYVYPKKGQSEEQQATDRYECHRWAVNETGHDPTLDEDVSEQEQSKYRRAITACLEGRGYTVK